MVVWAGTVTWSNRHLRPCVEVVIPCRDLDCGPGPMQEVSYDHHDNISGRIAGRIGVPQGGQRGRGQCWLVLCAVPHTEYCRPVRATEALLARSIRSPALLMAVYVGLLPLAGPWLSTAGPPRRNVPEVALGVMLAVLVTRGSRAARITLIFYSAAGVGALLFGSHGSPAGPPWARLWYMTCYLLQIGLLVSTPVFQRTRPGWPAERSARYSSAPFLRAPGSGPWLPARAAAL